MSRVFISYASEDGNTAEAVQLALSSAGHAVFFDEQSLPAGGDYHARIEAAIGACDVFVFLASPSSLAAGRYTLSELELVRMRWPSPVDRVLPVLLGAVEPAELPAYLAAATALKVRGNVAAEVRASVEAMLRRRARWGRRLSVGTALLFVSGAAVFTWIRAQANDDPNAQATARPAFTRMEGEVRLESDSGDYIGGGTPHSLSSRNGILTAAAADGSVEVRFEGDEDWSFEFAAPRDKPLVVGTYDSAQRTPFNNPTKPGLSATGAGRGCNELDGEFTVREISRDGDGGIRRLHVDFAQRCDGSSSALRGVLQVKVPSS